MNGCLELSTDEVSINEEQEWLRYAAYEGYTPAMYDYGLCCDDPKQRIRWLKLAAEEGHLQAMYLLGQESDDLSERRRWLQMAAEEGHVAAMHEFGLLCTNRHEKRRWLAEAARNGVQGSGVGVGGNGLLNGQQGSMAPAKPRSINHIEAHFLCHGHLFLECFGGNVDGRFG